MVRLEIEVAEHIAYRDTDIAACVDRRDYVVGYHHSGSYNDIDIDIAGVVDKDEDKSQRQHAYDHCFDGNEHELFHTFVIPFYIYELRDDVSAQNPGNCAEQGCMDKEVDKGDIDKDS